MSVSLIVTKSYDKDFNQTGLEINQDVWSDFVESQNNVRFKTTPYSIKNPVTGYTIEIPTPDGATEILVEGNWLPFLYFQKGELMIRYSQDMEYADNHIRQVIIEVASYLSAMITTDA